MTGKLTLTIKCVTPVFLGGGLNKRIASKATETDPKRYTFSGLFVLFAFFIPSRHNFIGLVNGLVEGRSGPDKSFFNLFLQHSQPINSQPITL